MVVRATPSVSIQRPGHAGETYSGDTLFVISKSVGLDGDLWCVLGVDGDEIKVKATTMSSAVAVSPKHPLCSLEEHALVDATLSVCGAHECGFPMGALSRRATACTSSSARMGCVPTSSRQLDRGGTDYRVATPVPQWTRPCDSLSATWERSDQSPHRRYRSAKQSCWRRLPSSARVVTVAVQRERPLPSLTFTFVDVGDADGSHHVNARPPDAIAIERPD